MPVFSFYSIVHFSVPNLTFYFSIPKSSLIPNGLQSTQHRNVSDNITLSTAADWQPRRLWGRHVLRGCQSVRCCLWLYAARNKRTASLIDSSPLYWNRQKQPDFKQQFLNIFPEPHGQGSFLPSFSESSLSPCTTLKPFFTCVSEGYPFLLLLIGSKGKLIFDVLFHVEAPFLQIYGSKTVQRAWQMIKWSNLRLQISLYDRNSLRLYYSTTLRLTAAELPTKYR